MGFFCKIRGLTILCLDVRHFIEREIKLFCFQTNLSLFVHPCCTNCRRPGYPGSMEFQSGSDGGGWEGTPMLINDQVHCITENRIP